MSDTHSDKNDNKVAGDHEEDSSLDMGVICLDTSKDNLYLVHIKLFRQALVSWEPLTLVGLESYLSRRLLNDADLFFFRIIYEQHPVLEDMLREILKRKTVAKWICLQSLFQLTSFYRQHPARLSRCWSDVIFSIETAQAVTRETDCPAFTGLEDHLPGLARFPLWLMKQPWPYLVPPALWSSDKIWQLRPWLLPALRVWVDSGLVHRLPAWRLAAIQALRFIEFKWGFYLSPSQRECYLNRLLDLLLDVHPQVRLEALNLYPSFSESPLPQALASQLMQDSDPRIVSKSHALMTGQSEDIVDNFGDPIWQGLAFESEKFISRFAPEKQAEARIAWRLLVEVALDGDKSFGAEIVEKVGCESFQMMFAENRIEELLCSPPLVSDQLGKRLCRLYSHAQDLEERVAILRWIRVLEIPEIRLLLEDVWRNENGYLRYLAAVFLAQQGVSEVLPYLQSLDMDCWNRETIKALFKLKDKALALQQLKWLFTTELPLLHNHPLQEDLDPFEDGLLLLAELKFIAGVQLLNQLVEEGLIVGHKLDVWEQEKRLFPKLYAARNMPLV